MSELPTYILERWFHAPRDLVWKSWTRAELLSKWYGPNVETVIHQLEVKPGGLWLNEMRMSHGAGFQRTEFLEVDAPNRLVCVMANSDSEWNVIANPMMQDWPRQLLTTVALKEEGNRTHLTLTWVPYQATEAEIACFGASLQGANRGWSAGMDLLAELLLDLQK